jgi:hypothetical protein
MAEFDEDVIRARATRPARNGCAISLMNILTAMIVVATLFIVVAVLVLFFVPDILPGNLGDLVTGDEGGPTPTLAVAAIVPTFTPSSTAAATGVQVEPTWTAPPAAATNTPSPTNTRQPTNVPSVTPTIPPATPTRTPTATPTDTATPGPSPTATYTRSPFPFTKSDISPTYLQNFANNAGCNWMGIGGEVLDLNGNPVGANLYRVHVWDNGIDERVVVGNAPAYGASGWEQFLFDTPRVQDHNVQLETVNGTAVSQVYRVQTRASCNQNLTLFVFNQNH